MLAEHECDIVCRMISMYSQGRRVAPVTIVTESNRKTCCLSRDLYNSARAGDRPRHSTEPATARSEAGRLLSSFLLPAPIVLGVVRCSSHRAGISLGRHSNPYLHAICSAGCGRSKPVMIRNTYGRMSGRGGPFSIWQVRETSAVKNWGVLLYERGIYGRLNSGTWTTATVHGVSHVWIWMWIWICRSWRGCILGRSLYPVRIVPVDMDLAADVTSDIEGAVTKMSRQVLKCQRCQQSHLTTPRGGAFPRVPRHGRSHLPPTAYSSRASGMHIRRVSHSDPLCILHELLDVSVTD